MKWHFPNFNREFGTKIGKKNTCTPVHDPLYNKNNRRHQRLWLYSQRSTSKVAELSLIHQPASTADMLMIERTCRERLRTLRVMLLNRLRWSWGEIKGAMRKAKTVFWDKGGNRAVLSLKYVLSMFTNKSKRCWTWQHRARWQPLRDIGTFVSPSVSSVQGQQDEPSDQPLRYRVLSNRFCISEEQHCRLVSLPVSLWGGGLLCWRQITLSFLLLPASLFSIH